MWGSLVEEGHEIGHGLAESPLADAHRPERFGDGFLGDASPFMFVVEEDVDCVNLGDREVRADAETNTYHCSRS